MRIVSYLTFGCELTFGCGAPLSRRRWGRWKALLPVKESENPPQTRIWRGLVTSKTRLTCHVIADLVKEITRTSFQITGPSIVKFPSNSSLIFQTTSPSTILFWPTCSPHGAVALRQRGLQYIARGQTAGAPCGAKNISFHLHLCQCNNGWNRSLFTTDPSKL